MRNPKERDPEAILGSDCPGRGSDECWNLQHGTVELNRYEAVTWEPIAGPGIETNRQEDARMTTKPPPFEPWPEGPYKVAEESEVERLTADGWIVVDHWDAERLKIHTSEYYHSNQAGCGGYYPHNDDVPNVWKVRRFLLWKSRDKQLDELRDGIDQRVHEACNATAEQWRQELENQKSILKKTIAEQDSKIEYYRKGFEIADKLAEQRFLSLAKYETDMAKLRKQLGEKAIREALEAEADDEG